MGIHSILFFLKNIAGDMDGHVDRDFTPNSHTSFHYRQNEVGETGSVLLFIHTVVVKKFS